MHLPRGALAHRGYYSDKVVDGQLCKGGNGKQDKAKGEGWLVPHRSAYLSSCGCKTVHVALGASPHRDVARQTLNFFVSCEIPESNTAV